MSNACPTRSTASAFRLRRKAKRPRPSNCCVLAPKRPPPRESEAPAIRQRRVLGEHDSSSRARVPSATLESCSDRVAHHVGSPCLTAVVSETGDVDRPPALLTTAATKRKLADNIIADARRTRPRLAASVLHPASLNDSIRRLLL